MPLAEDVDLDKLAELTHGFVGADLEVLAKEAGMLALHEVLDQADFDTADPAALAEQARIHLRHFVGALKSIEPTATRELVVERPTTRWSDVGGLIEQRAFLEALVELPRKRPELFEQAGIKPPRGILFHGPSGGGKSLVARALAGESGLSLITVDAANMLSKWLGESEKALRQVFTKAKQAAPCILLLDDLDSLAPNRGGDLTGGALDRLVGQLMSELDALDELTEVLVIGSSNRPDLLDQALISPSRFPITMEFPLPDEATRAEVLRVHTAKMPLADDVDLVELARQTEEFSGSDLAALCQRAALEEIRAMIGRDADGAAEAGAEPEGKILSIAQTHFDAVLPEVRRQVSGRSRASGGLLRLPTNPSLLAQS
jgi:transitional endoplasmic reticulum ATPase